MSIYGACEEYEVTCHVAPGIIVPQKVCYHDRLYHVTPVRLYIQQHLLGYEMIPGSCRNEGPNLWRYEAINQRLQLGAILWVRKITV